MPAKISIMLFSDVLCIWAHIAHARVEEVKQKFGDDVEIHYRFCSVFGDTAHKMATTWKEKGGIEGFASHLHDVASDYDYISLHEDVWTTCRPHSSVPAHLAMKAIQLVAPDKVEAALLALRKAFFEQGLDIANADVLEDVLRKCQLPVEQVRETYRSGLAHALLEADGREKEDQGILGSPTFILNNGRQKLYGNVGYRVIEANILELLKSPGAGTASWC